MLFQILLIDISIGEKRKNKMPIFDVKINIHDGEHEYIQSHYVYCKTEEEAQNKMISHLDFNNKTYFKIVDRDSNNKPNAWEEKPGYRIYEIESVGKAKLNALGFNDIDIDLTSLFQYPVLPLNKKSAEVVWTKDDDCYEYWWYMGMYYVFLSITPADSDPVYIGTFESIDVKEQTQKMEDGGWKISLNKGEIK